MNNSTHSQVIRFLFFLFTPRTFVWFNWIYHQYKKKSFCDIIRQQKLEHIIEGRSALRWHYAANMYYSSTEILKVSHRHLVFNTHTLMCMAIRRLYISFTISHPMTPGLPNKTAKVAFEVRRLKACQVFLNSNHAISCSRLIQIWLSNQVSTFHIPNIPLRLLVFRLVVCESISDTTPQYFYTNRLLNTSLNNPQ